MSARFADTHWSIVLQAGGADEANSRPALETLCRTYWYPVYAWIRGRGFDSEESRDLTQDFFVSLLRRESLSRVDQQKGRFRTFLIRSIQYFLADYLASRDALKRGGGVRFLELDAMEPEKRYALEPMAGDSPDAAFDRRWAHVLVTRALARLEAEQVAAGRGVWIEHLREFIGDAPGSGDYGAASLALGISRNTVAVTVRRLRQRCRDLIVEEVRQTVGSPEEAEEELRALFRLPS